MATANQGIPQPGQIILFTDSRATVFQSAVTFLGIGAFGETTTLSALEATSQQTILGNGTSGFPGLGNPKWQQLETQPLLSAQGYERYDVLFSRQSSLMNTIDSLVQSGLPPGWIFSGQQPLDAWLTYLNGAQAAPATPASVGVLTAGYSSSGSLPNTVAGSAPRVVHCLVGSTDQNTSLSTAEATQVALAGSQNSYTYQIAGTVPAGVYKVRMFRGLFGGSSGGPYYWDQDVSVTPLAAYPPILILQGDNQLLVGVSPPSWMQCAMSPAAAAIYGLSFAAGTVSPGTPMLFNPNGMFANGNVLLWPTSKFLGIGNPVQSGIFGSSVATGPNAATFTAGAIQTANNPATDMQGFAGAYGIQCRCTSAFTGTLTPTITYTYYDAAHGWANLQTATGVAATSAFNNSAVGATITFSITAGRIVQSVTETSVSGTATVGAYQYEGVFPR